MSIFNFNYILQDVIGIVLNILTNIYIISIYIDSVDYCILLYYIVFCILLYI